MAEVFEAISWTPRGSLRLLDQTRLPGEEAYVECRTVEEVAHAIRTMQVRGAPAIGVAAAIGLALGAQGAPDGSLAEFRGAVQAMGTLLAATRPTAVNLAWAIGRMLEVLRRSEGRPIPEIRRRLLEAALALQREDVEVNRAIGRQGHPLLGDPCQVLTHCNAGGLATAGYGTAIGVIRAAVEAGKRLHVWVDETRPLLQGARLTAWELIRLGIPATLITDSMAGSVMRRGQVDAVIVGADRIARNGDVANKIGTYGVAVLARAHRIPFYVAAPLSTLDLVLADGSAIPIEERSPEEVTHLGGRPIAPVGVPAANPAFDVTPAGLVDAVITERGVARPPYAESLARLAAERRAPGSEGEEPTAEHRASGAEHRGGNG
jgi:methylthioribose-1-phosphate isomerase